jgi:Cu/Ag efflux protein CusF
MKNTARLLSLVVAAGLAFAGASTTLVLAAEKTHEMTTQVVSVDLKAKTITIKDEKGENKTAPVLEQALESLKTVKAGDRVTLTCLDDENGQHKGVSGIKHVKEGAEE